MKGMNTMAENGNTQIALDRILKAELQDINKDMLDSLFGGYHDRATNKFVDPPFKPYEKIKLTKDIYPYVKEQTISTSFCNCPLI